MGDITKYKDKIDPGKEYEIVGQDILNVINTIDSLKNEMDSLSKHNNSIDTLYDTVYLNTRETIYDTVYINVVKTKEQLNQTYRFIITMVVVIGFLSIMIYASTRSY